MASYNEDVETAILEIIVKSYMKGGSCYLGLNREKNLIMRPVKLFRENGGIRATAIDDELYIGNIYKFTYKRSDQQHLTQFPHANEDLAVIAVEESNTEELIARLYKDRYDDEYCYGNYNYPVNPRKSIQPLKDYLLEHAGTAVRNVMFVYEGTDCPSVTLLKCNKSEFYFFTNIWNKRRIMLRGIDFPYTAKQTPILEDEVVVIMSMGRPLEEQQNACYVLVAGLM